MFFGPEFISNLMAEILVDDFCMKFAAPLGYFAIFLRFCGAPLFIIALSVLLFNLCRQLRADYLWVKHFE